MFENRIIPLLVLVIALIGLCLVFPPFRFHSLKEVREAESGGRFDATEFANRFWTEELLPEGEKATEASEVIDAIHSAPESVGERFGRTVGVGDSYFLFLRGTGRVVSADEFTVGLSLDSEIDEPQLIVELGFVFGNAVRDATGLIKASSYANAQEFNDISAALNGIVETNVMPQLQKIAKPGVRIQFLGCVEVNDIDMDLQPLRLVPILVKAE